MARSAGLTDEELVIPALDSLRQETFEILAPVYGLTVTGRRPLGAMTLLPRDDVLDRLREIGFQNLEPLSDADAFVLGLETARLAYDAEQAGHRRIDTALDLVATRLRHALATFPNGEPQPFARDERRALPRRGDHVVVRGLLTGRRWLRSSVPQPIGSTAQLAEHDPLLDGL